MRWRQDNEAQWVISSLVVSRLVRGFFTGLIVSLAVVTVCLLRSGAGRVDDLVMTLQVYAGIGSIMGTVVGGIVGLVLERRNRAS